MTLSLTCACGVHLEVDESFAGQTINCPDCQRPLRVPARGQVPVRTSGLAITSLVMALVGAFTILGTILATMCGFLALASIRRAGGQIAGRGYALAGIVLGFVLTGLALYAFMSFELFGFDELMQEPQWLGRLDYPEALPVTRSAGRHGYRITRPSKSWGMLKAQQQQPNFMMGPNMQPPSLLLVYPKEQAYIVCVPIQVFPEETMDQCARRAEDEFRELDLSSMASHQLRHKVRLTRRSTQTLTPKGNVAGMELMVDKQGQGPERTFLLRVWRRKQEEGYMYLVAGGTRKNNFARMEPEIRRGLDSFEIIAPNP
jgi:hypothetical protein